MPRHKNYVPHGVIPAVLLPFETDLSIDEPNFRRHLSDVAVGRRPFRHHHQRAFDRSRARAASTSRSACSTSRRTRSATGCRWSTASGPTAVSRRRGWRAWPTQGGASALLVFPPAPFMLGAVAAMAIAHFKRIADATDLPLIVFQYPLATTGYRKETLIRLCDEVPTHPRHQGLDRQCAASRVAHPHAAKSAAAGERADHALVVAACPRWCSAPTGCCQAPAA